MRVGFAGLTHLGLVSAAAAADRGFDVVGFDADAAQVERLQRQELPVTEPGLPELLGKHRAAITFTARAEELATCALAYVAPDVATDDLGQSDLVPLRALIATIAAVLPADTPRALSPERFIVGCADPAAALPAALGEYLAAFGCPILRMGYESAELAKIAINVCLVASISAANTLAELCERIGADWAEIVPALRLDRRIGAHAYLGPGLGIAGGNLERDLATVSRLADTHGTDAGVVRAWLANSRHRRDWALAQLHERVLEGHPDAVVALLGLSYKADTASTKNSPALALLAALTPFAVRAYDPVVATRAVSHERLVQAASALEACAGADGLAIMTPWTEFRTLAPAAIAQRLRGRVVIDPYGVLATDACRAAGLEHVRLGSPLPAPRR
ncbi:MAG: GDP-mannose dehydrogenase [Candidatus Rokuibacteriota bacterium]|nr:MAG: GDP-mannose dehydrogenase [Candidatus Rokubacteria bacterium]